MQSYEIEIKSLLGSEENAGDLRAKLKQCDPSADIKTRNRQLNHYFEPVEGNLQTLADSVANSLSADAKAKLLDFASKAKEFSVRTRDKDGTVLLVVKASIDSTTSANGIARMEFEEKVSLSLQQLDDLVQAAGFKYQAKWSREREEYVCNDIAVTLDKNAGYGWLAEFEMVVDDESKTEEAQKKIRSLMATLGVAELSQERLARMFDFYNKNWADYYGTDKIFVVH